MSPRCDGRNKKEHCTSRMVTQDVLRDESIRRRLDRHTLVAILDGDVMHIVVVSRYVEPIRLPNMVRNDLTPRLGSSWKTDTGCRINRHVMGNIVVPKDRHMKPARKVKCIGAWRRRIHSQGRIMKHDTTYIGVITVLETKETRATRLVDIVTSVESIQAAAKLCRLTYAAKL